MPSIRKRSNLEEGGLNSNRNILAAFLLLPPSLRPWLGIAFVLGTSRGLLMAVGEYARLRSVHPEMARKTLHVGMGGIFLAYPWLFSSPWPTWVLAGIYVSLLMARVYFVPLQYRVAGVIYGVERRSYGEFYFPLSASLLFSLSRGDLLLYTIPFSLLVFADAAAAIIGTRYGSFHFQTPGGRKSVEGSLAFIAIGFLTTHVILILGGHVRPEVSLISACMIAMASAVVEAICWNGFDNIAVPLMAFGLLRVLGAMQT